MDLYGPAEMTSTHTGNPVCGGGRLGQHPEGQESGLAENARAMGHVLLEGLERLAARHPSITGAVRGRGLVAGLHIVKRGTKEPDGDLAFRNRRNGRPEGAPSLQPRRLRRSDGEGPVLL